MEKRPFINLMAVTTIMMLSTIAIFKATEHLCDLRPDTKFVPIVAAVPPLGAAVGVVFQILAFKGRAGKRPKALAMAEAFPAAGQQAEAGTRALQALSHLLPRGEAERYSEEWRCELYELHEEGARWHQRAAAVLQAMRAALKLAVTLRLGRNRVIE